MTLKISFELTDSDLQYFRDRFQEAHAKAEAMDSKELLSKARALVDRGTASNSPEFVRRQIERLGRAITMVEDDSWQIPADESARVLEALAYFVEPTDIIADDVPVLGLIDDAIAIELALRELQHQIEAYEEFSEYRSAEAQRRTSSGQTTDISKEDWLADRRAVLHSRVRERHSEIATGWHFTTF